MRSLDDFRSRAWLIYACRTAYTAEVAEIVWRTGGTLARLVDNLAEPTASTLGPVIAPTDLTDAERVLPVLIPLTTPGHRHRVVAEARALGFAAFPALIDPTSTVARTAVIGEGTIVNAQTVIGAQGRIGRFVHINRSSSIGHDADIADYATLGPACVLSGHVTLERGAFVGAGAVIAPHVRIGANAIVGIGAVVMRDVLPGETVLGNPARVLPASSPGYAGVTVPCETFRP